MKACADPKLFNWPVSGCNEARRATGVSLWKVYLLHKTPAISDDWWFEDVSFLSLPLYKRLIQAVEVGGMTPENIAGALVAPDCYGFAGESIMQGKLGEKGWAAPSAAASPCIVEESQLTEGTHSLTSMTMVANLVDAYLSDVSADVNLKFPKFQSLAAAVPDYARPVSEAFIVQLIYI
ncbi:Hypothetical predicted protein [Olea europaea subsp. europaea]|uniref:NPH3 domain-containing protein n=1 Tax=Olea europaea subsp. europaea TaxID=158383 RepID=A0A8S0T565_OLEEU|nr:Hypothetical predicted protein [Olea europaea subsp. europaea]